MKSLMGLIFSILIFAVNLQAGSQPTLWESRNDLATSFVGHLDSVTYNAHSSSMNIKGWACFKGINQKPWIGVYAPASSDLLKYRYPLHTKENILAPSIKPLRPSEDAVNNICQNGFKTNRFDRTIILKDFRLWSDLRRVLVMIGQADPDPKDPLRRATGGTSFHGPTLTNSGRFQLPLPSPHELYEFDSMVGRSPDLRGAGYIDMVFFDLNQNLVSIHGWACHPRTGGQSKVSTWVDIDNYYLSEQLPTDERITYFGTNFSHDYYFRDLFSSSINHPSEKAVNDICQNNSSHNRFVFNRPVYSNDRHYTIVVNVDAKIDGFNKNPVLLDSTMINNSGKIFYPLVDYKYSE